MLGRRLDAHICTLSLVKRGSHIIVQPPNGYLMGAGVILVIPHPMYFVHPTTILFEGNERL